MRFEMADPVTIGAVVAWALGLGGEAVAKGALAEAAKDAYQALKAKVSGWAATDVVELEKAPDSSARQMVIAETINRLPPHDQELLHDLAKALAGKIREQPPTIGLDVGRLKALEVELGNITVAKGVGARIQEAEVSGTFRAGDISVGTPPGKR